MLYYYNYIVVYIDLKDIYTFIVLYYRGYEGDFKMAVKYGWHCIAGSRFLEYGGNYIKPGTVLELPKHQIVEICSWGYHACARLKDCFKVVGFRNYIICRVKVSGGIEYHHGFRESSKFAGRKREVLYMVNGQEVLECINSQNQWDRLSSKKLEQLVSKLPRIKR